MRRVDLVGASGVGKTTLYNYLDTIPPGERGYLTIREAYRDAALSQKISFRHADLLLFQLLLKSNATFGKERGIGTVIIRALERKRPADRNKYNDYSVSFEILCDHLRKYRNPYLLRKRIRDFLKKADSWIHMQTYLQDKRLVIIDECILHYHSGIGEYGFENYSREQLAADEAFRPAGIINCTLNAENVYKQAVKRKEEGVFTFGHGHLEGEALKKLIKKNIEQNLEKVSGLKEIGVPVLEVNTGDSPNENAEKIKKFILSLQLQADDGLEKSNS